MGKMTEEDIKKLSCIHFAFGLIKEGRVYWDGDRIAEEISRIREASPSVRLVLSVGGWGADGFSQAASSDTGRKLFTESCLALVEQYGLDGLDIDWEYPCIADGGIAAMPEDKENFTFLLQELRSGLSTFPEYKTLSIAAGGLVTYLNATNMGDVSEILDYVQLMTYDFHIASSELTGHIANLYPYRAEPEAPSADGAVRAFVKAGVPVEKIVMGAAFYGRVWRETANVNGGLAQKGVSGEDDFLRFDEVESGLCAGTDGFREYWDDEAQAAYASNDHTFVSFESRRALSCKAAYVKENGMYGLMYWEYGQDAGHTLTDYLFHCLNGCETEKQRRKEG